MTQITFRLPPSEMEFLHWYSEKTSQPISTIYRKVTFDSFLEWKTELLLEEYKRGSLGVKAFCRLGNLTFHEAILLLQEKSVEPPITELMDLYTSEARKKLKLSDVFKDGVVPKRKSSPRNDLEA